MIFLIPVAWATAITGMNPGGTGIFDFIHRDPLRMLPTFSGTEIRDAEPVEIGPLSLPTEIDTGICVERTIGCLPTVWRSSR